MYTYNITMAFTTIKITTELRDELKVLKIHPRQSYEDVITKLIKKGVEKNDRPNEEGIRD